MEYPRVFISIILSASKGPCAERIAENTGSTVLRRMEMLNIRRNTLRYCALRGLITGSELKPAWSGPAPFAAPVSPSLITGSGFTEISIYNSKLIQIKLWKVG
jgi:hypothetical protein